MAKNQSKLRNAVDAVFAPSQYLTHDGAAYAQSKLGQIFNRASKSSYMIFAAGVALETMVGIPDSVGKYAYQLGVLALIDAGFGFRRHALDGLIYDTKAENRCFVEPEKASALKKERNYGALYIGSAAVIGSVYMGADIVAGNYVKDVPFISAFAAWSFGNYWRPKQVLDGNWTLLDKAPPEKQTSKAQDEVPANAMPIRIHNREIAPAVEL